jgi:hypothetical protein
MGDGIGGMSLTLVQRSSANYICVKDITMARIQNNNLLLRRVSGKVGNLILKCTPHGDILTKYPDMINIVASADQKTQRSRFRCAVDYAQQILADPTRKLEYSKRLKRGRTVYHTAIAEYLTNNPSV